ncbi:aminoglycoside phosphotransferase family protein [Oerskovia flava]|uniref:aminoglycoside phosphotransferase family protein n=1 Tax=Oerskovia flava TaxID=2986422 RepID=UPI00223F462E|nr:aminoglycoside phosphotransferase family protein [Oerskovia sp. JB1-3-2]
MPDDASAAAVAALPEVPRAFGGSRLRWSDLPEDLRTEIEAVAGARVVAETTTTTGFSPGLASVLTLATGERIFVKAARTGDHRATADLHRAEAHIAIHLPRPVPSPRFLWGHGDTDWIVLAYEAVAGRVPPVPWPLDDLDRVLAALDVLAHVPGARAMSLPPAGPELASMSSGWARLRAEPTPTLAQDAPWAAQRLDELVAVERHVLVACEGEAIVHGDIRGDNVLLTADAAYLVDWPHAMRGAPWLDLALFLPSVLMQGVDDLVAPVMRSRAAARDGGAWAARRFAEHPLGARVHPGDLRAVVAGIAGYFLDSARKPPPPDGPGLRPFQRAQGIAAVAWLEELGI